MTLRETFRECNLGYLLRDALYKKGDKAKVVNELIHL